MSLTSTRVVSAPSTAVPINAAAPETATISTRQTWTALAIIGAISLPLFFLYLGSWAFFDPDEGRYAEIPREMIARGDFITPTLNYVKYFEKPPLLYWIVAAFYKMFGFHEWAGRLVPALAALAGLMTTYFLGRRMFGQRAGLWGALILATSAVWTFLARELLIDMLLSAVLFAAYALWWLGHTDTGANRARYFLGFWVALALAVLTKGPVSVVLVGGPLFGYMLLCRQWQTLRVMQFALGVPLFLLITAPWFILVAQRNPGFNHFFWYRQHIGRFLGLENDREHAQGFFYFFQYLPLLLLPWSLFIPGALAVSWKKVWPAQTEPQRAMVYLMLCAGFIFLFFSASTSKLLTYVLPAMPCIALMLAAYFDWLYRHRESAWRWPLSSGAALLLLILAGGAVAGMTVGAKKLHEIENLSRGFAVVPGVLMLVWAGAVILAVQRRTVPGLVAAVTAGMTVFVMGLMPMTAAMSPNHYVYSLVQFIRPGLQPGTKIIMYQCYAQSVGFYTQRRLRIYNNPDEMKFGMEQLTPLDRQQWFPDTDLAGLRREMASPTPVYCFVRDHEAARMIVSQLNGLAAEVMWNKRRSIIGNRAAVALTPPKPGGLLGRDTLVSQANQG